MNISNIRSIISFHLSKLTTNNYKHIHQIKRYSTQNQQQDNINNDNKENEKKIIENIDQSEIEGTSNTNKNNSNDSVSFAKLLRESKFVQLGNLKNKKLIGKIVNVVDNDLYIDYGGKFLCVCKRPFENSEKYIRNAKVLINLRNFEMASHFLGAAKHITLLESDADLIGLYNKYSYAKKTANFNSQPYNEKETKTNTDNKQDPSAL